MTHVVTEHCERCRFTECVTVCPVECFHGDAARLYIDADVCIDCGACVPVCPVRAISETYDLEPGQDRWIQINRDFAAMLPVIRARESPLPDAEARRNELGFTTPR